MSFAIPYLQFRSDTLIQYNLVERDFKAKSEFGGFSRAIQESLTANLLKQDTYTGKLTIGSKKRLTRSIETLIMAAPKRVVYNPITGKNIKNFQLSFITLTLATDIKQYQKDVHKSCLEPFLRWMRDTQGCTMYVWKAEFQRRGQLHYHITSDAFIHIKKVRDKWNELQIRAGYLDMASYIAKHGHAIVPGTEIKKVWKEVNLGRYLVDEFTKAYQNDYSVGGKIWDCSINLKKNKLFTSIYDSNYNEKLTRLKNNGQVRIKHTDHCTIYKLINKKAADILSGNDRLEYNKLMESIRTRTDYKKADNKPAERHYVSPGWVNKYKKQIKVFAKEAERDYFKGGYVFNPSDIFDFPDIYRPNSMRMQLKPLITAFSLS